MTDTPCLTLFTVESVESIRKNGGSIYWKISPQRAMEVKYAVLVQNRWKALGKVGEWDNATDTPHEHGHAFMVATIRDVVPANEEGVEGRYRIRFSAIAPLRPTIPNCWKGERMPVNYQQTIEGLGIDLSVLVWETIELRERSHEPKAADTDVATSHQTPEFEATLKTPSPSVEMTPSPATLTIAQAKQALAATFGVKPEAVEISIRG